LFSNLIFAQPLVSFSGNKASSEGNSGFTNMVFNVNLSQSSAVAVSVDFATLDGTALAGSDYIAASGTLVFNPGQTSKTITVQIIGDVTVEPHETFTISLSNPVNALLGTPIKVTGSIFNDDNPPIPSLSISGSLINEGNSSYTNAVFDVNLSAASTSTVTVNFSTSNGNAQAGPDYVAQSGTLTFPPGTLNQKITVLVVGDATFELNENFFVNISNPVNATISIAQGQGTVINDDDPPSISINDVNIVEGDAGTKLLNFTISLSQLSGVNTTVSYATVNNSATGNASPGVGDYTMKNDVVVLNAGTSSLIVDVPVNGDIDLEADETFYVDLSNSSGATILKGRGVGTILNDDYPFLSINDVGLAEGNAGTSSLNFTVTLSPVSPFPVTVDFNTIDGTATGSSSDYISSSGTLTFAPGEISKSISVLVNGDTSFEPDETFSVDLTNPTNAKLGDNSGLGKILNDDSNPTISINDVTINEGNSGTSSATFTVTLSSPSTNTVTVNFTTVDGTALAGSDYISNSGALTFSPGETTKNISVIINGDVTYESNETFTVNLTNSIYATISDNTGVGTIGNDDANTSTVSNFIWKDLNGNGIQDAGEPPFENIYVELYDATSSALIATDYTTPAGLYEFLNVPAGTYEIAVSAPPGWGFTSKDIGTDDAADSDINPSTSPKGFTDAFSVVAGVNDDTRDAGLVSANTTTTKTGPVISTVGEQVTYTLSVHNSGPTAAGGVVLKDPLPQGTTYVASTGQGEYSNGSVTWNIGTMQSGSDVSVTVTVTTNTPGTITNTSSTTSTTVDPNPNDNSSSTTTEVSPQTFTLTVTRAGSGSGTVTSTPVGIDCGSTCTYTFTAGTVVTLVATPDASSTFAGWSGAATGTGTATITMDGNKTVAATFSKIQYTLNINRTGQGTVTSDIGGIYCGSVCSATYDAGTVVTLTATPDIDYQFDGWSGDASGSSSSVVITMDGNKTVGATFSISMQSVLRRILQDLITLQGTVADKSSYKKMDEAIKNITEALNSNNWMDGNQLNPQNGKKVFNESNEAVGKLKNIMKEKKNDIQPEILQVFIDRIIQVNRELAVIAVQEAISSNGDPKDIAKANDHLSNGDKAIQNSKYENGIEHYRDAWKNALKALPQSASRIPGIEALVLEKDIDEKPIPTEYALMQNYPNPFNPTTSIKYQVSSSTHVTLKVYDVLGRELATLVDEFKQAGSYNVTFNARHLEQSREIPSGIYFYRMVTSTGFTETKKLLLMK
jgi:uncharacterized repeat protein (TIGR01451 family)